MLQNGYVMKPCLRYNNIQPRWLEKKTLYVIACSNKSGLNNTNEAEASKRTSVLQYIVLVQVLIFIMQRVYIIATEVIHVV